MKSRLFVGLLSGTSMDGADAALVEFSGGSAKLLHASTLAYPDDLRSQVKDAISQHARLGVETAAVLDVLLGRHFAVAVEHLLTETGIGSADVTAIGSHGQTICHAPDHRTPFTLQLGDPNVIAQVSGIDVVADFRRRDIAAGGQGAPLAPLLHNALLRSKGESRAVINIGGIANITLLADNPDLPVVGFDTGPGNCLLDENCAAHLNQAFDEGGQWAATGHVDTQALAQLLADPYFGRPGPKSTGREGFNSSWLKQCLGGAPITPVNLQATLSQLTAESIAAAIESVTARTDRVLVCGGGIHNTDLMQRLAQRMDPVPVLSTATAGIAPEWVEAQLFAWLAERHSNQCEVDTTSITGANCRYVPGAFFPGRR